MQQEKFTRGIAEFYNCYFNNGEHEILYINEAGKDSLINPLLTIKQTEKFLHRKSRKEAYSLVKYLARCDCYDYIVIHSLFFAHYTLLLHPKLVKKFIWIAWGYDLYNWPPKGNGLRIKVATLSGKWIRNHCSGFVGIFPPDCDVYRDKFPKSKAKVFYAPYCSTKIPEEYQHYVAFSNLDKRNEDNKPIYIQIGHSAVKSVNHIETLDSLRHLKDENIRVFLPLSYGDAQYGEKVQKYAESIFGEKAICLRDFMPAKQYFALLERIDVAIFNTHRQIGLGNINRMIFRNVKMYLPEDSVMYQYFTGKGVPIQKYGDLQNLCFEELRKPVKTTDPEVFGAFIESFRDMNSKVEMWKTVYETMRKQLKGNRNG